MGIEQVRFEIPKGVDAAMLPEPQERKEAQEWLEEQQQRLRRRDNSRYWAMLIVTTIAAIAACIAAWPEVKRWFV
jgi:type IV secretory pathway component VirB8